MSCNVSRIYHTWDKWECYRAGFFNDAPPSGMTKEDCEQAYKAFLSDLDLFKKYALLVISEWTYSCEHNLTNESMNRIAWIGQAAMCRYNGISSVYRGGFNLLSEEAQQKANDVALDVLNQWLFINGYKQIEMPKGYSDKGVNKY